MRYGVDDLLDDHGEGVVLHVHVQPGAGRTEVTGRHGDALKVRVRAPAVEGRATAAARDLVAQVMGLPTARVELVGGATSRAKRFLLAGLDRAEAGRRLAALLDAS